MSLLPSHLFPLVWVRAFSFGAPSRATLFTQFLLKFAGLKRIKITSSSKHLKFTISTAIRVVLPKLQRWKKYASTGVSNTWVSHRFVFFCSLLWMNSNFLRPALTLNPTSLCITIEWFSYSWCEWVPPVLARLHLQDLCSLCPYLLCAIQIFSWIFSSIIHWSHNLHACRALTQSKRKM